MACTCIHQNQHMRFPVFGPQPAGPAVNWPVYFVPDATEEGFGHYYCPKCKDGLVEARAAANVAAIPDETTPTFWERFKTKIRGFFDALESPKHLSA